MRKTPISKRPDAFSDLDITVFAQKNSKTSIILRDENGESQDTGITAENSEDMYAVGVYNYTLPKEYFADNYPEEQIRIFTFGQKTLTIKKHRT